MQAYLEAEGHHYGGNSVYMELQAYRDVLVTARPHLHSALEIVLMQEGQIDAVVGDTAFVAGAGDLFLVRSNTIHHFTCRTATVAYWVLKIKPSLITELAPPDHCGEYLMFFALEGANAQKHWSCRELAGSPLQRAAEALLEERSTQNYGADLGLRLCSAQLLLAIMRFAQAAASPEQSAFEDSVARRIYDAVVYINKNYNQAVTAQECSRIACMSYSYFSRSFRAVTGKNFKEYLNQVRVAHAEKALLTTDKSVTEAAAHCGYDNVSYFISVYKRLKGETPHAAARRKKLFGNAVEIT